MTSISPHKKLITDSKTKFYLLFSISLVSTHLCYGEPSVHKTSSSAVSDIGSDELTLRPGNSRVTDALWRTLPSSLPGQTDQTTHLTLRGINHGVGNSPLFVVDGKPVADGAMADFDPSFIESIQILKGPGAKAIYGNRGNAGVVIITTKAQIGYTDNPTRQEGGDRDSSSYFLGGVGLSTAFGSGNTSLSIGGDISFTQYDKNFDRNGDDEYDLNFSYKFDHKFSDLFGLRSYGSLHYGAHQSIERGYQRTGLGFSNALDWYSHTSGTYSLDGKGLGTGGLEGQTAIIFSGFNESGFDARDVSYLSIEQEISKNLNESTRVGITAEYGMTDWKQWSDFDADVLKVGGFVRTNLGSGFSATVSGGWEQRKYDQLDIKRNDLYLNGTIRGPIVEGKVSFFALAGYGVQQNYLNATSSVNWVDPIGLRLATGLRAKDVGPGTLAVDLRLQHLESDLFSGPKQKMTNYSLELTYAFEMKGFEIAPSIIYFNDDFDNGNDSDGFAYSLSVTKQF